ncbi:Maf family protein [Neisseria wadsworthii]|uniref:Maf family protein n=1 Tax=Neisseria wadsworthii TaxID=607711 RepID=UPI000D31D390|nr:nucleoside triphosphate pyrophosphatase [Neisseria wadsworthii]
MKPTLYLASGSPRRREILENLGYQILQLPADIDETPYSDETASPYVKRMATEKNAATLTLWHNRHTHEPEYPLLTADTTIALNEQILGKPDNAQHAAEILAALSGSTHQVLTSVCVYFNNQYQCTTQISHVTFKALSKAEISAYIDAGEPLDKAGAYGIQGLGGVFVKHLQGSFTGVMGLPVYETTSLLNACGYITPPFIMK